MNPLDKLKSLYESAFDSAKETTKPGDRLRETAARLKTAFDAADKDELTAIGSVIDSEIQHVQGFLYADVPASFKQNQQVVAMWKAGLTAHGQGWMALYLMYEDNNPGRIDQAMQYAEEGDTHILQVFKIMRDLNKQHPATG